MNRVRVAPKPEMEEIPWSLFFFWIKWKSGLFILHMPDMCSILGIVLEKKADRSCPPGTFSCSHFPRINSNVTHFFQVLPYLLGYSKPCDLHSPGKIRAIPGSLIYHRLLLLFFWFHNIFLKVSGSAGNISSQELSVPGTLPMALFASSISIGTQVAVNDSDPVLFEVLWTSKPVYDTPQNPTFIQLPSL